MSVLIKGMRIPKNCAECPVALSGKYCRINQTHTTFVKLPMRPDHCPLVELPEHHGDLVDVNEIRWDDHYDSDGNLSKYKVAYSDEMPDPVIKGDQSNNECIS
jgi:hypothetical protein